MRQQIKFIYFPPMAAMLFLEQLFHLCFFWYSVVDDKFLIMISWLIEPAVNIIIVDPQVVPERLYDLKKILRFQRCCISYHILCSKPNMSAMFWNAYPFQARTLLRWSKLLDECFPGSASGEITNRSSETMNVMKIQNRLLQTKT